MVYTKYKTFSFNRFSRGGEAWVMIQYGIVQIVEKRFVVTATERI